MVLGFGCQGLLFWCCDTLYIMDLEKVIKGLLAWNWFLFLTHTHTPQPLKSWATKLKCSLFLQRHSSHTLLYMGLKLENFKIYVFNHRLTRGAPPSDWKNTPLRNGKPIPPLGFYFDLVHLCFNVESWKLMFRLVAHVAPELHFELQFSNKGQMAVVCIMWHFTAVYCK